MIAVMNIDELKPVWAVFSTGAFQGTVHGQLTMAKGCTPLANFIMQDGRQMLVSMDRVFDCLDEAARDWQQKFGPIDSVITDER